MRLSLFIDYQNAYMGARDAFRSVRHGQRGNVDGQVDPVRLAELIAGWDTSYRSASAINELSVRVYRGRPRRDAAAYGQWLRQTDHWKKQGAEVVSLPLGKSGGRFIEKGIDVSLALDFYAGAVREEFEVGVLFSMDRDFVPLLNRVVADDLPVLMEVVSWADENREVPYSIVGEDFAERHRVWRHFLDETDYQAVWDSTNYTRRSRSR